MMEKTAKIDFRENSRNASPAVVTATQKSTRTALLKRAEVVAEFGEERWQELRKAGHEIRLHALTHLDRYLAMVEEKVTAAGGLVHWARDAEEAKEIILKLADEHGVQSIVKVKSMVSEEIDLNPALEARGIKVYETDLGEFIVQQAGQRPSHITAPALHMTKEEIADLFREKLGIDARPIPEELTEHARLLLRPEFLRAGMGISGGNFLIAETGTLLIVTNEGNGRLSTSLPPVHVAVVGIEKVIPDWESAAVLLKLLARSVSGSKITAYNTFITGVREGGPKEFHLVLLDNGRSRILADELAREALLCIRCGACMNSCPIYNQVGGYAYGAVYQGPIGSMLTPLLMGTKLAGSLPFASTLCGACAELCPVMIPIPEILLHLRKRFVEGDSFETSSVPGTLKAMAKVGRIVLGSPTLYRLGARLGRIFQSPLRRGDWLPSLPPPLNRWTMARPFPAFQGDFRLWWKNRKAAVKQMEGKTHG
ncbi:MAG: LutB/LldF family L-lactate oxidation iron-sulfur protein [Deltaproteobacteria bacterium]|nr:LutB/LldF family L-lactate oxidation iron-sulfur protein [Deltaproteobacteria bacterium]